METTQYDLKGAIEPALTIFLGEEHGLEIGVAVRDGIVTLTGEVDSEPKKAAARKAVAGVFGVKAIINNIEVAGSSTENGKDGEITEAVLNAISAIRLNTILRTQNKTKQEREIQYWEIFT